MKLNGINVSGIRKVVINGSYYDSCVISNSDKIWEHKNITTNNITKVYTHNEMVKKIKQYVKYNNFRVWISGDTINIRKNTT